jgi:hypothetical protein
VITDGVDRIREGAKVEVTEPGGGGGGARTRDPSKMDPAKREELKKRLEAMTPEQREEFKKRLESMTPEQREEFRKRREAGGGKAAQ